MGIVTVFFLCSFAVVIAQSDVIFEADRPYLSVPLSENAVVECCWGTSKKSVTWIKYFRLFNGTVSTVSSALNHSSPVTLRKRDTFCGTLTLQSVQLTDSGLYRCRLNKSEELSHGTYLHVYKPLQKTLNLSESTKNKILTAEGVLLLLCVMLPSATLLCKSKRLHELEKKKAKKEEENIYQGLNLDDCCTTYDQIERAQMQGPYQDVCNIMEEEEEIQLEKP